MAHSSQRSWLPSLDAAAFAEPGRHSLQASGASSHSPAHTCVCQTPTLHIAVSHAHALALTLAASLVAQVGHATQVPSRSNVPAAQGTQCWLALFW